MPAAACLSKSEADELVLLRRIARTAQAYLAFPHDHARELRLIELLELWRQRRW